MTAKGQQMKPRGRPSNSCTADTVAVMLVAARKQFAAQGYAATSNRTVANAAGLAHTAIYNHFGSKAQLFTAVFLDVQDRLIFELQRSAARTPDEPAFPGALLDAIEELRAADPTYVEFLASMYVEVRRHPELRNVFQGEEPFPIVDVLRSLAASPGAKSALGKGEDPTWFWITFALGLAQLSALADTATFATTVEMFRQQFVHVPGADS
ncbi:MAG: TetR family transcriptional regulator [Actinobacteria bacterium]|nr:TetR family transcriptional regulator [Actinomycetota bacterium]MSX75555.1 TetR family transcriptional regulator [Actinomycetota bacterium]MSY23263.1 TetR family transcriptional regulator [Actinomycetota bacterium]